MAQSQIHPPNGWNTDPEELDYEAYWAKDDSDGQRMAKRYKLERAQPIMCSNEMDGVTMFKAGNKFYFWNEVACGVWEILSSQDLDKIIEIMTKKGSRGLKMKELP